MRFSLYLVKMRKLLYLAFWIWLTKLNATYLSSLYFSGVPDEATPAFSWSPRVRSQFSVLSQQQQGGLGARKLHFPNVDCEFHQIIINAYPKFQGTGDFELLRCKAAIRDLLSPTYHLVSLARPSGRLLTVDHPNVSRRAKGLASETTSEALALPPSSLPQPRQSLIIKLSFSPWVPEARASTPALSLSPPVHSQSSVLSRQQQPSSACIAGPSGSSYSGASPGVTGQSAGMSCLMKFVFTRTMLCNIYHNSWKLLSSAACFNDFLKIKSLHENTI